MADSRQMRAFFSSFSIAIPTRRQSVTSLDAMHELLRSLLRRTLVVFHAFVLGVTDVKIFDGCDK